MGALRRAAPVPGATAGERPFLKQRVCVAPAAYGEMARESSSARRAGAADAEESSLSRPKRTKVIRSDRVAIEMEVIPVSGELMSVGQVAILRKRMASELDTLRGLVKKVEILSLGKNGRFLAAEPQPEAPTEAGGKTSPAKRRKVSPLVERIMEAPRMAPDERKRLGGRLVALSAAALPDHVVEFLQKQFSGDTCPHGGGPSELEIDIHSVEDSVLFELKKQQVDTYAEDSKKKVVPDPAEEDEDVDICGGASPPESPEKAGESSSSDSGSSASDSDSDCSDSDSSSDSDSESSESDSDESVSSPAPPSVLPKKNDSPAQPPEPASLVAVQSTEPEMLHNENAYSPAPPAVLPEEDVTSSQAQPPPEPAPEQPLENRRAAPKAPDMATLLARAREAMEIRQQKGKGWEKEKLRRKLREVERAALPDESIHPRELASPSSSTS